MSCKHHCHNISLAASANHDNHVLWQSYNNNNRSHHCHQQQVLSLKVSLLGIIVLVGITTAACISVIFLTLRIASKFSEDFLLSLLAFGVFVQGTGTDPGLVSKLSELLRALHAQGPPGRTRLNVHKSLLLSLIWQLQNHKEMCKELELQQVALLHCCTHTFFTSITADGKPHRASSPLPCALSGTCLVRSFVCWILPQDWYCQLWLLLIFDAWIQFVISDAGLVA